jgi:hypothetical protein
MGGVNQQTIRSCFSWRGIGSRGVAATPNACCESWRRCAGHHTLLPKQPGRRPSVVPMANARDGGDCFSDLTVVTCARSRCCGSARLLAARLRRTRIEFGDKLAVSVWCWPLDQFAGGDCMALVGRSVDRMAAAMRMTGPRSRRSINGDDYPAPMSPCPSRGGSSSCGQYLATIARMSTQPGLCAPRVGVITAGLAQWVGRPNRVKLHGSVLHAMLCGGVWGALHSVLPGRSASDACIARDVILRLGPPVCCVQYAGREDSIAANSDCTP